MASRWVALSLTTKISLCVTKYHIQGFWIYPYGK